MTPFDISAATPTGSAADFDFFIGAWRIQHRRLKERLLGCQEWDSFEGSSVMQKMLGGLANVDDNLLHLPDGDYRALTLRSFDAATGQWAIWWLDGRRPGQLDVPVVGQFRDGIGCFYADDTLRGQPIRVRFMWTTRAESGQPRWEQAFSNDGGASWECNWVMDFSPLPAGQTATPCA
ncbi:DUF1579 domain-containing protein [Paucibacter sp. B2R-40]|uniref:DUF1579 domain-containing protein n=1 Tax=Paucibacter sp. B2R-40 TaxID=2893554 RepID=UPI0021E48AAD|nr:DUF1579 domain-containing protein [Paucibacter sp. B2R-40]MCV2352985.1 DUF1579 domain-containing protein [Paucibacter sp. B2R-40]